MPGVDRHELRARKEADGEGSRGALAAVLGIGVSIAIIAAILMSTGWLVISVGMIKLVIVGVGLVLGIGAKVSSR